MFEKLKTYLCEALGLGLFMLSASVFDILVDHPGLPVRGYIHSDLMRRFFIGSAMGLTALYILNSPFGKRSGAHINPSVTIVQYRIGNIKRIDATFYILFQFLGAALGVLIIDLIMPALFESQTVNYIVTKPQINGIGFAFALEFVISFILISVVLYSNTNKSLTRYTAWFVAFLITIFITFEAPFSGMSMNPARTFGSAIVANQWDSFWLYCIAPPLGMICGELFIGKVLHKELKNVTLHNDKK